MKSALLLERDPAARRASCALLRSMGYLVAAVETPNAALNALHALRCDLVLTDTTFNMDDRRAFLGELTRLAPHAPIVLLTEDGRLHGHEHRGLPVLARPVTLRALRRVVEFGVNGHAMTHAPAASMPTHERRRHAPRRAGARND